MPIVLKSVAGLFAGVVAGTVSLAVWMPDDSKPVETHLAAVAPAAPLRVEPASGPTDLDRAALTQLAQAMGVDPAAPIGAPRNVALTPVGLTTSNDDALRLRAQGLMAFAGGEVTEARAFLERAAEAGDARALLVLGDTYDPTTLASLGAVGIKGDVARAQDYYARAREAGVATSSPRLAAADFTH